MDIEDQATDKATTPLLPAFTPPINKDPTTGRFRPGNYSAAKDELPILLQQSPQQIEQSIQDYLSLCIEQKESATIPGLALAMGFSCKEGMHYAMKHVPRDEAEATHYASVLRSYKKARSFIENQRVQRMVDGKGSTIGAIFDLKCSFGYQDTTHIQQDTNIHITWGQGQAPEMITDVDEED